MKLYCNDMSPAVRGVLLTARALDLQFEPFEVDIFDKDRRNAELGEVNPQCTVPTLVDGGLVMWESHAIAAYLVGQYGATDDLYPKEPHVRALVDQKLHFDCSILHPRVNSILQSIVVDNEKEVTTDKLSAITEAYAFLNAFLANKTYLVNEQLTIADLCCVASVSTATIITPICTEKYPFLSTWYRSCRNLPFYEESNGLGLNKLDALVELKLGRPRTKEFSV